MKTPTNHSSGPRSKPRLAALAAMALLAIVAWSPSAAWPAAQWWTEAWIYRRGVTLSETPSKLPGDDIAVFEMYTGDLVQKDGGDIRVVTPDGREMPTRVLMTGPGDRVRVAFALGSSGGRYYVYFGNPKPTPPKELEIKRGVLLETWAYVEGGIKSVDQAQKTIATAKEFIGRDFRDRIFQGHNPFGPQNKLASVYTAWFIAPQKGNYVFACSSTDASFLLVDDKLVVDDGGHHKPEGDVSRQGKVDLEQGLHKLTFYHISTGGDPIAVAAWQSPGSKGIKPMPADAFAPVAQATAGPLERYGKEIEIGFDPVHAGEAFVADRYTQRYLFDAQATGPSRGVAWQWDFGDELKSSSAKVEHVFLIPGAYKVTLTARTPSGTLTRANRIFVARPWDQVTENKLDSIAQQGKIVAEYDFQSMPADALAQAIVLLERAREPKAMIKAGAALTGMDSAPAKPLEEAMLLYAEALSAGGEQAKAIAALTKGAKMTRDPAVCANLLVQAGQLAVAMQDAATAADLFETVLRQYARLTTSPAIRLAHIGVGDSWRLRGDYDKAREAYLAVMVKVEESGGQALARGDYARHVEDYIRLKQLEAARQWLDKWANSLPADRLEGYLSLMKCRYYQAADKPAEAAAEAEILVKVNPTSSYAPELLMLASESYDKLRKPDKAKACLQLLADKYKESPLSVEAAKKLAAR